MVEGRRKEKLAAEISSGAHTLIADVSSSAGGTDLGMSPHQLLEAALTACTIITVQMYADRHKWKLESTNVKVTIDKEGAESHMTREIQLVGELSDDQRHRLMDIAGKCPVHRILSSRISISTKDLTSV
jgi:putative redox protein